MERCCSRNTHHGQLRARASDLHPTHLLNGLHLLKDQSQLHIHLYTLLRPVSLLLLLGAHHRIKIRTMLLLLAVLRRILLLRHPDLKMIRMMEDLRLLLNLVIHYCEMGKF